jgi:hypothetical protein
MVVVVVVVVAAVAMVVVVVAVVMVTAAAAAVVVVVVPVVQAVLGGRAIAQQSWLAFWQRRRRQNETARTCNDYRRGCCQDDRKDNRLNLLASPRAPLVRARHAGCLCGVKCTWNRQSRSRSSNSSTSNSHHAKCCRKVAAGGSKRAEHPVQGRTDGPQPSKDYHGTWAAAAQ